MHLSGKTINLISDDYTATIVTMGGAIANLKYKGRHIVMPFQPHTIPIAHQGKILAPWPNRIADGRYTYNNQEYQLPITDVKTNCATHGLVAWKDWVIADMHTSFVELETYVSPIYGYPFLIKLSAHYEVIDGMGLKVDLKALNVGKEEAPFGIGMHPYITCEGLSIDECKLSMPFDECFSNNERKCPESRVKVEDLGFNFKEPSLVGTTEIDHCFIAQNAPHVSTVQLESKKIQVYLKTSAPYIQLFTPAKLNRRCLAVEPMSCPGNSFNNGIGLIRLKEQQYYSLNYLIGALEK